MQHQTVSTRAQDQDMKVTVCCAPLACMCKVHALGLHVYCANLGHVAPDPLQLARAVPFCCQQVLTLGLHLWLALIANHDLKPESLKVYLMCM